MHNNEAVKLRRDVLSQSWDREVKKLDPIVSFRGQITKRAVDYDTDIEAVTFTDRERNISAIIEIPRSIASTETDIELEVEVFPSNADIDLEGAKIVFNGHLHQSIKEETGRSLLFSSGGFIFKLTSPESFGLSAKGQKLYKIVVK